MSGTFQPEHISVHTSQQIVDEHGATIAIIRITRDGPSFQWGAAFFVPPLGPLPDTVRAALVACLRFHADRLEDRDLDKQMRAVVAHMPQDGQA